MFQDIPHRLHRRFYVYKDGLHVLTVADEPGFLVSTASPPPGGPPRHPFLDGTAHQALYEGELAGLLGRAESFDEYLSFMIHAGYDIASDDPLPLQSPGAGVRLLDGDLPVGAAWQSGGQFTCLWWQPPAGEMLFTQARLTVYLPEWEERLFAGLQGAVSYDALNNAIHKLGLKRVNFQVRSW